MAHLKTKIEKAANQKLAMLVPIGAHYPFDAEVKLLRSLKLPKLLVLDIGANTGSFSELLEDIVGPENLVLFEPQPDLSATLGQRFNRAETFDIALSDADGWAMMRIPGIDGTTWATRATLNDHVESDQTGHQDVRVRTLPLDSLLPKFGDRCVGLIKIDVEGHELNVLNGARTCIRRNKPLLLIEIEARHHDFPVSDIFSRICSWGYRGYYLDPQAFALRTIDEFDASRDQDVTRLQERDFARYLNNFFFVHESSQLDFVGKATSFLASEKALAARWPDTILQRIARQWLRFLRYRRQKRRAASPNA